MIALIIACFFQSDGQSYPTDAGAIKDQEKKIVAANAYLQKCERSIVNPTIAKRSALGEVDNDTHFIFPSNDYKKKQIDIAKVKLENAKDYLDELKAGFIPKPLARSTRLTDPLKVGDSGSLPDGSFKVFQIVGNNKFLADIFFSYETSGVANGMVPFTETKTHTVMVMIKNYDQTSLVDGTYKETNDIFVVAGTETYKTLAGSKTVFVLEPRAKRGEDKPKEELEKEKAIYSARLKEIRDQRKKDEAEAEKQNRDSVAKKTTQENTVKSKEAIIKLAAGLTSYTKRYDDSFNESNPKLADQMQAQAITYIQNGDKRLAEAVKAVKESTLPEDEKTALIKQATDALATAKKKVGVR